MSDKMRLKDIKASAKINVDKITDVTYFPWPEPATETGHFVDGSGNITRLYTGDISGLTYRTYGTANTFANSYYFNRMGNREKEIINGLDDIVHVQSFYKTGYDVLRFIDYTGEYFDMVSRDNTGHNWEVC